MSDTIGPYEILGELGRGAMAVVWLAHDPRLDRQCAIKEPVIPNGIDSATIAELSARFVREGKAAAKLNHPGIVTIHAADIYDGRPAIVMERIEGETLSRILDRGALPVPAAMGILDQLLDAIGFAHSHGIVHRDVKPDNIFVTHDGRVKLTDFGIAHVGSTGALTQAGAIMGTPGYMAPEQVTGQPVDARADLFAIGVIAYEMFTGANPFGATDGEPTTTVMYRIVHESAPPIPAHLAAGMPLDLAGILSVALAKDAQGRFADAQSFRNALAGGPIVTSAAAGGSPLPMQSVYSSQAAASTVVAQQATSAQRSWLPYAIVAGVGAIIIGMFALSSGPPAGSTGGVSPNTVQSPGEPVTTIPAAESEQVAASTPVERALSVSSASASSELRSSGGTTYGAYNLLDGYSDTCWAEAAGGYGGGESVTFLFGEPVYISQIGSLVGYDKSVNGWDRWFTNGRLKVAKFEFSDGTSVTHQFVDTRTMQWWALAAPVKTTSVRMSIVAAYEATGGYGHDPALDTSVAEVGFMGWSASAAGE